MRKKFTFALISFLVVPLTMMAQTGTKGNTITFDSDNSTMLYTELDANTSNSAYSCYLRHNQAPIQLLNANPENVSSGNTVATLQSASGTGTGFFANSSLANNMGFSGTSSQANRKVQFYNLASSSTNWKNSPYKYICFAVIAPRGYRFTEYYMDIDGSQKNGADGATIMRYTYNAGSTYLITECSGEELRLTRATSQIFNHTLSNAENMLYFRIEVDRASTQSCITMNQLRLTYVIDGDIEATIPNDESSVGNKVHTGIINLGTFTRKGTSGDYYFDKKQVNDLENVNIVEETVGLIEQPKIDNNAIFVPAGTYWIESPAKFRITKAKVTFKAMSVTGGIGERSTTFTSGKTYLIGDGSGNYMGKRAQGTTTASATSNQSNQNNAERWTITQTSSEKYTIQNSQGNYLCINGGSLGLIASLSNISSSGWNSGEWSYDRTNRCFYSTITYTSTRTYRIYYSNNSWSSNRYNNYTSLYFYEVIESITADNYTAEVYNRENTGVEGSVTINSANNASSGYVELTELNNDGIKFKVDGDAAFTVDLTLHPLDPTLQNLEFGYKVTSGEPNLVSAAATNFKFNNGEAIVIPIESGVSSPKAIFRNAYNENRRDWYNPGSGTKLSNYYLIDSEYETSNYTVESPAPNAKVDADRAGTTKIEFSNIKDLTKRRNNATEYKETEFNKSNAGYNEIEIPMEPNAATTVYIYSADKPEYCIMTTAGKAKNNHVAYTFYDAKLQGVEVVETPKVEVIPIYTKTYKGDNSKKTSIKKDSSLDEDHVFYGVTVTSQSDQGTTFGHLKAAEIVTAISTEMQKDEYKNGTYGADDPFRTILYVDMSSLNSISGDASSWNALIQGSADNCLFFMPSNFSTSQTMTGGGMIAGGENGVAVTDVVVIDQQPFYSPYNFRTSTHVANYTRKVTPVEGHENTTTVTLVLPFSVGLDAIGHPRTSSDHVNSNVQFLKLTDNLVKNTNNDKIYDVVLAPEGSGTAVAHTPYIVQQASGVSAGTVFDVSVLGARFVATGTQSGNAITFTPLTGTDDASFTSYGTFNGTVERNQKLFYFSKDYFWNTKTLSDNYINIRPFRAWYKSDDTDINALAKFGLIMGDETTGINEITTIKHNSNVVYDIQGRVVSNNGISALPKGLYIMNGKKIFIK